MDSYSWTSLIGGLPIFLAFLLSFSKNHRRTVCASTMWVIGSITLSSAHIFYYLQDSNGHFGIGSDTKLFCVKLLVVSLAVLTGIESVLLFPWVNKCMAMRLGKILFLIVTPTLLLLLSVLTIYPSFPMHWTFPLGAGSVGSAVLWFRIRENCDASGTMSDAVIPSGSKFRMAYVFGWTACVVIVAFLLLLAAPDRVSRTIFPFLFHARATSSGNACINNLRQLDAAANQFALENHLTNGSLINFPNDLTPYIKLTSAGKIPSCPNGGFYHISKVGEIPTCSMSTLTPAHVLP